MTTPSTFGTIVSLIRDGMVEAGYIGRGRDPTSDHLALYFNKLNYIFNHLQVKPGLKLWLNFDLAVTPVAGRNLYTLGPSGNVPMTRPLRSFESYFTDSSQNRRPVSVISRNEWDTLSTTTQQGTITSIWPDKQKLSLNINTWLTPDAQAALGVLHVIVTQQSVQRVSLTDDIAFPVEWYLAIMWEFASQISTGQPQAIMDRCGQQAERHLTILEDWDVEDASTYFAVDQRSTTHQGRFR